MRRKIVKQGASTLTLSLPTKWVKRYGLKPGDDIEVSEGDEGLVLSPVGTHMELKGELDITGLGKSMIWRYMNTFYVNGFDEIAVTGCDKERFAIIKEIPGTLIGFSLVEQRETACIIKCISETKPEQFDDMIKRIFFSLNAISKETLEAIVKKNFDLLKDPKVKDREINNAALFCLRILSKYGHKDQRKTTSMHEFVFFLENIGDMYAEVGEVFISTKGRKTAKDIEILERVNKVVSSISKIYKEKDNDALKELYEENKAIKNEVDKIISEGHSDALLYTIRRIPEIVGSIVESLMMLYL
jgi:phosphate uptake regulator